MNQNRESRAPIATLERLVAFDTVSSRSNAELIDWAANRLESAGAQVMVQRSPDGAKANLFATIGPADRGGLMLSGHSDVVPVTGQSWSSDPFKLVQRDGNLYARGSADMKGFIACVLDAAPRFAARPLKTPLHVALSYDEETTMSGMRHLVSHLAQAPVQPAACLIGEPTSMQLVVANKGAACWRVHVRGHSVHSSLRDSGVSAVEVAAGIVTFLMSVQQELRAGARHDGFEFPHTSIHVGQIQGGTAHNITALDCEFVFEVRALPGQRAGEVLQRVREHCDAVLADMQRISPDCEIRIEPVFDSPALDEQGNTYLARALAPMCAHGGFGRVSFATEAGILQDAGVPTVVCGPGRIAVAHQPDEHVEIEQLEKCMDFLDVLAQRLEQGMTLSE